VISFETHIQRDAKFPTVVNHSPAMQRKATRFSEFSIKGFLILSILHKHNRTNIGCCFVNYHKKRIMQAQWKMTYMYIAKIDEMNKKALFNHAHK